MEPLLFLSLVLCTTLFLSIFLKRFIYKDENSKSKSSLPYPPGTNGWPFVGESLDYFSHVRNDLVGKFLKDRQNKYSTKVFKTCLLGEPTVFLAGAEGNKFIFSNENKQVQMWWPNSVDKIFPTSRNSSEDESINLRKMLPTYLKADALKSYIGIMDSVARQHLQFHWDRDIIKVCPMVHKYSFSLACRLFFSIDDPKSLERLAKPFEDAANGIFSVPINFPGTNFNRAVKASQAIRKAIEGFIKKRRIDLAEKRATTSQDVLSHMVLATDGEGRSMSDPDIATYILGLLIGGHDTTGLTLTFIMWYLAELPDIYNKVHKEQMEVARSKQANEALNWDDLRKMKYSWNVASEVLRLRPPNIGGFRAAITDITYGGYTIPKGWKFFWTSHTTHKNPDYFPDPEKFDPTRFEGSGPAPYSFIPFGGGPRMCPGNEYARAEILVFMHYAVTKFRWEKLIPDEKIVCNILPRPAQELPIRLYPLK